MSATSVELEPLMGMAAPAPAGYPAPGDRGTNTLCAAPACNGAQTLRGLSQTPQASWLPVPPALAGLPMQGCARSRSHGQHWSQHPVGSNRLRYPFPRMDFPEGISVDAGSVWDELIAENPFCPEPKANLPKARCWLGHPQSQAAAVLHPCRSQQAVGSAI